MLKNTQIQKLFQPVVDNINVSSVSTLSILVPLSDKFS